jgi:hypothetical protein
VLEKILKLVALVPPDHNAKPSDHYQWRWLVTLWVYAVSMTVFWGFGWSPLPYSPIGNLDHQVGELKSAVVCSNLKSDLERARAELYAVQREIEMNGPQVTETVLKRRADLETQVRDNETRYEKNGCYTVIG